MENTRLLYMEKMWQLEGEAAVQNVIALEDKTIVILDQTLFYAQGGGQPYDQGVIESANGRFRVEEVRFMEGIIKHGGHFESGRFAEGEQVQLKVNPDRRALNSRLHSGGHIIDMALRRLQITWKPFKGYHFPDGPYDEYIGEIEGDADILRALIEKTCNEIIAGDAKTTIEFLPVGELMEKGFDVPNIAPEKPLRLVHYGTEFAMPCGGTHVPHLASIGTMKIRRVKQEKDHVRVAYELEAVSHV
jgi:alanyl-tRNA synthetase